MSRFETHYLDMTTWELEQERRAIIKEIERRIALEQRAKELEVHYGPHRINVTADDRAKE